MNCQLIENPKMRRGPHKMPSWAACLRPLVYNIYFVIWKETLTE